MPCFLILSINRVSIGHGWRWPGPTITISNSLPIITNRLNLSILILFTKSASNILMLTQEICAWVPISALCLHHNVHIVLLSIERNKTPFSPSTTVVNQKFNSIISYYNCEFSFKPYTLTLLMCNVGWGQTILLSKSMYV